MVLSQPFSTPSFTPTVLTPSNHQSNTTNQETNSPKGAWNFSVKVTVNVPTDNGGSIQMEMEASTGTKSQVKNILNKYK